MSDTPTPAEQAIEIIPGAGTLAPLRTVRDLATVTYHLVIECLTPYVHSSGTLGNETIFMRERVANPDRPEDLPEEVPCITGNSLRHALREACAWLTLRLLDIEIGSLTPAAWHFLASGGALGAGAATLDVAEYRRLRDLMPFLGLFGGGTGTALTPGKLQVSFGMLLCEQNARRIGALCDALAERVSVMPPAQGFTERRQKTRRDARDHEAARHLLPGSATEDWDRVRHTPAKEKDGGAEDDARMIAGYEVIIAGAQWYWSVGGRYLTPLEHSTLVCGLIALEKRGELGAQNGTGHGKVRIRVVDSTGDASALRDGLEAACRDEEVERLVRTYAGPYADHVRDHAEEITTLLREWE